MAQWFGRMRQHIHVALIGYYADEVSSTIQHDPSSSQQVLTAPLPNITGCCLLSLSVSYC